MTTTVEEITLDESLLDDDIPCECVREDGSLCGRPAVFRLTSRCYVCRVTSSGFACHPCWMMLRPWIMFRDFVCAACGAPRTIEES